MSAAIETSNLKKTYKGGVEALRGVSLEVERGRCFGLLGPNGAGKSTLVKSLLSIVRPSSGSAKLLGVDIRSPQSRAKIGYLPEGHRFPSYLTARGVCEYFGRLGGLAGPELAREIDAKLELVGLTDWSNKKVAGFSKGMAQRVGMAQALMGDPDLLFLDEPTDGVDPVGRAGLHYVLRQATERGATIFINSHLLSELEDLCDEVAILHRGEIIEQGSVAALTATVGREGVRVRFKTGDLPTALHASLEERGAEKAPDGHFDIDLASDEDIPNLIDELREANVPIYSVVPQRMRLEDAFVEIISAKGGTHEVQR